MKESVFDVLMYLFENYLDTDVDFESDQETLRDELVGAGFPGLSVDKAFDWLEGLGDEDEDDLPFSSPHTTRIYTREEMDRLDVECRGFILFLEQVGVLDGMTRERVIDRVMALECEEFDLEQLKWVVLMVLFNRPGRESMYNWMEDLVIEHASEQLN
ncbi:MAG: DUF494 domain-containing protein [Gammaproteobacteria bacterium]|nr:DUF494 domain-containing protein [Gammaproteobacteria bacterium]